MRTTGIDILKEAPWGTHLCQFYKTKEDLIDILVPYFKNGLKNNEFCMWITSEPLKVKEAKYSLKKAVKNLDDYIEKGQIEILNFSQWYTKSGGFDATRVLERWVDKEEKAVKKGFDGLRLSGNTFWLDKKDWACFSEYEEKVNNILSNYRILVLCSYSLDRCGANEILEVAKNHKFALIKEEGKWIIIESHDDKEVQKVMEEIELFNYILFQYNPIETIVVDRQGRVIRINLAKKNSGEKLPKIGDEMYKGWPEKNKIDLHQELMECIKLGKTKRFPEVNYDKKFFSITMAGYPKGAIITSQDITKRKLAEIEKDSLQQQLIQSAKMAGIGTLSSGIAHEFNNLLQIMSGHIEIAKRTRKPEYIEEAFNVFKDTSERASKIIRDLSTFTRLESSEKKEANFSKQIESILVLTEKNLAKHNIEVVRKYGRIPKIKVNREEMQQVLLNMLTNARDAMLHKGGKLEISIKKIKENIEISFTDSGKGIRKENLSKVFEPFYTTKGAVGEDIEIQGTGLGLSVSYGIVKRHGGTIEVVSEVGKGTTFTIKLPV